METTFGHKAIGQVTWWKDTRVQLTWAEIGGSEKIAI